MLRLDELIGERGGKKAEHLAQALAAGLPVLDGVVLLPGEALGELPLPGDRFIVRSSSNQEDRASGIFLSIANMTREELSSAIERVRASANSEAARALHPAPIEMSVLIQPMSRADRLGVATSIDGGFLVEERKSGEPEWGDVDGKTLREGELFERFSALEKLLGGPVDVEYASDGVILQVRPRARAPLEQLDAAFLNFKEPGRWRLDAEHNPRPLSAAQASLVEMVERLEVGPRQRVIAGWLYVDSSARNLKPIPLPTLRQRFDEEVAPACRAQLSAAVDLADALDAYGYVYRRYVGEISPAISRAKAQLDQLLRMNLGEPLSLHGALLGGVGGAVLRRDQRLWEAGRDPARQLEYLRDYGAWSAAWDVAVPTDEENFPAANFPVEPQKKHEQAVIAADDASAALLERLDRMARRAFKALLPTVRAALEVGEDDDALFFEAQRLVRRMLLAQHHDFDLPIGVSDERLAEENRAARLAASRLAPPPIIEDGEPRRWLPPSKILLRGHKTSGFARGRAVQGPPFTDESILVVPALIPSLAHLLPQCRALVTAHGGATSHGATLAREYGIPAVLGARGADQIEPGEELIVDGANGVVIVISPPT
jgi:phosphohistidine swiveling domain-containing protein